MTVINSLVRPARMEPSYKLYTKPGKLNNSTPKRTSPITIKNGKNRNQRAKSPPLPAKNVVTILPRGVSSPNLPIFDNSNTVEGSQKLTVIVNQMNTPKKGTPGKGRSGPRRYSPSKSLSSGYSSSSGDESRSPKDNYAGARFHLPPEPTLLPKPPTHWVQSTSPLYPNNFLQRGCGVTEMSSHLKTILKVQVQA